MLQQLFTELNSLVTIDSHQHGFIYPWNQCTTWSLYRTGWSGRSLSIWPVTILLNKLWMLIWWQKLSKMIPNHTHTHTYAHTHMNRHAQTHINIHKRTNKRSNNLWYYVNKHWSYIHSQIRPNIIGVQLYFIYIMLLSSDNICFGLRNNPTCKSMQQSYNTQTGQQQLFHEWQNLQVRLCVCDVITGIFHHFWGKTKITSEWYRKK